MAATSQSPKSKAKPKNPGIKVIEDLLDVMIEIIEVSSSKKIVTSRGTHPFMKFIDKYNEIIKVSSFDKHAQLFSSLYTSNRDKFLNITEDDDFLRTGSLQIWYGEELPNVKRKNIRIPISGCYNMAMSMKDNIDDQLTGDAEKDAKMMGTDEYLLGTEMLYYLMVSIRMSIKDAGDRTKIDVIIKNLAKEAGLGESHGKNIGKGLSGVVSKITNAVKSCGLTGPDGSQIDEPPSEKIGDMIETILDNKSFTQSLSGVLSDANKSIQSKKDISLSEMTAEIFGKMGPVLKESAAMMMTPPDGVNVTPESQRQAEAMASGFDQIIEQASAIDFSKIAQGLTSGAASSSTVDAESEDSDGDETASSGSDTSDSEQDTDSD